MNRELQLVTDEPPPAKKGKTSKSIHNTITDEPPPAKKGEKKRKVLKKPSLHTSHNVILNTLKIIRA